MSKNGSQLHVDVTENGPYKVPAGIEILNAAGDVVTKAGRAFLCRCGGSQNKPFCDGTHTRKGFAGDETADHGLIADRRDAYEGDGITIFDDRSVCAHIGECTDGLPAVWRLRTEPWIDATAASASEIAAVAARCPSGALTYALTGSDEIVEAPSAPAIKASKDGPYRMRGGIEVRSSDGEPYERRERQTLCRCGGSRNKPFCDGSHWKLGFKDG